MTDKVPGLSIVFLAISCVAAFAIPVVLFVYFRKKKKADVLPFIVGCVVFVLFALVIEGAINNYVLLHSPAGETIQKNIWLYALYGGFMAGLFEETGRFLAFKTVLRPKQGKDINALMYGAGHGGIEAAILVGFAHLSNIIYSMLINSGGTGVITSQLSGDTLAQVEEAFKTLTTTPSWIFLLSIAERVFAVAIHLSLSVLVWFAAKKRGKLWLYPLAILLHLLVDGALVVLAGSGVPTIAIEGVIGVLAAVCVLIAVVVWKRNHTEEPTVIEEETI